MNIYISKYNEERLRQEDSMSGLINELLNKHYGNLSGAESSTLKSVERKVEVSEYNKKRPVLADDALSKLGIIKGSELRAGPICKIHGTPLTPNGKCLQKGCKYS